MKGGGIGYIKEGLRPSLTYTPPSLKEVDEVLA